MFWQEAIQHAVFRCCTPTLCDILFLYLSSNNFKHHIPSSKAPTMQTDWVNILVTVTGEHLKVYLSKQWIILRWRLTCPLKINVGRCIPYWNRPFLGSMLAFRGCKCDTDCVHPHFVRLNGHRGLDDIMSTLSEKRCYVPLVGRVFYFSHCPLGSASLLSMGWIEAQYAYRHAGCTSM